MSKKKKLIEKLIDTYKKSTRSALIVFYVIRTIILICMVTEIIFHQNYQNAFLCVVSLFLISIPVLLESTTSIRLPSAIEITIVLFAFAAEILGEIGNFYGNIPFWDTILHTVNGFFAAAIGFGFIDILNKNAKRTHMSPHFVAIVAFCFSMTIGVLWEFCEYTADRYFHTDTQKDTIISSVSSVALNPEGKNKEVTINDIDHTVLYDKDGNVLGVIEGGYLDIGINDTMKDLFVNLIGAVVFSILGYLYLVKRDKYAFVEKLIIYDEKDSDEKGAADGTKALETTDAKS